MKIAICWAHGVGKTTLSRILSEKLNLPILPDIVVDAFHLGFEINENTPIETQIWLTGKQLENEKINTSFVADKCIFDYFVYADVLGMDSEVVSVVQKIALRNGNYDYIFYIRPEFPIKDDGIRSINPDFQKWVQDRYERFLKEGGFKYIILTGSVEERVTETMRHLSRSSGVHRSE